MDVDETEVRFGVASELQYPYEDFADDQETWLYEGGLTVSGDLRREGQSVWAPGRTVPT